MKRWDKKVAALIDHTILKSSATEKDVRKLCEETVKYGFASAVVNPYYVPLALSCLEGSSIPVCSVVSFPFGADAPHEKARQAEHLLKAGAREIDMVMNVGAFLSGNDKVVKEELDLVASLCRGQAVSKIIIETACLDRDRITKATGMGIEAGFDYIKTSTGYADRGVSVDDVVLMRSVAGDRAGIKASGGIRTRAFALELIEAGASRIGCSRSLELIKLE